MMTHHQAGESGSNGVRISWMQIVSAVGVLLIVGGGLVVQQARQDSRITALEANTAQIRAEMIGQRRFDDFARANEREHQLLMQQLENLEHKMDQHLSQSR